MDSEVYDDLFHSGAPVSASTSKKQSGSRLEGIGVLKVLSNCAPVKLLAD